MSAAGTIGPSPQDAQNWTANWYVTAIRLVANASVFPLPTPCALLRAAKELKTLGFPAPCPPQPAAARALDRRRRHANHPPNRLRGPLPLRRHTPPVASSRRPWRRRRWPGPRGIAPRSETGCCVVCRRDTVLAPRPWPLDPGLSILAPRSWPLDPGPWPGVGKH
jgi:hypothetical protein